MSEHPVISNVTIAQAIDGARQAQQKHEQKHDVQLEIEAAEIFDCPKCGDGDALRAGEACAYCGFQIGT